MKSELPSGWVEHCPLAALKGRDKDVVARIVAAQLPAAEGQQLPGLDRAASIRIGVLQRDAVWAQVLTGWSYDLPLPHITGEHGAEEIAGRDSIGELPLDDFEALGALLAPYVVKLTRAPDPKGHLTVTTSSSNGSSRAKAGNSPTG